MGTVPTGFPLVPHHQVLNYRLLFLPPPLSHDIQVKEPTLLRQHHKARASPRGGREGAALGAALLPDRVCLLAGGRSRICHIRHLQSAPAAQGGMWASPGSGMLRDGMEWDGEVLGAPGRRKSSWRDPAQSWGEQFPHTAQHGAPSCSWCCRKPYQWEQCGSAGPRLSARERIQRVRSEGGTQPLGTHANP